METYSTLTELDNGILKFPNAMPLKDLTSDNESTFAMNRKLFNASYIAPVNYSTIKIGNMVIQRKALGLSDHQVVIQGGGSVYQKKWIGGNRDSSQVTTNRRVNSTGAITANVNQLPTSFKNVKDNNTARQHLQRVRSGGSIAPPKTTHNYKNAPIFY
jgi:hypothetical protein